MSDILQAADATAEGGYVPSDNGKAVIKVIGVGGGGGNSGLPDVLQNSDRC